MGWRCLGFEEGLGAAGVHASVPDGSGRVWISANRGIGVAYEEVLLALDDPMRVDREPSN